MGTAVFGLAAELTNWRREENPLRCGFKCMLLFVVVVFVIKTAKERRESAVQNKMLDVAGFDCFHFGCQ